MSRTSDLLNKAADALDDGQIPLMNPFLAANDVTLDECYTLADNLAAGARILAWIHENPQKAATLIRGGHDLMRLEQITELLSRADVSLKR